MIKCNLSTLMGKRKVRIAELARDLGVHRNTVTLLYNETAQRIELDVLEKICRYFDCQVGDVLELYEDVKEQ